MFTTRDETVQMVSLARQILEPEPEELFALQFICMLFFHDAEDEEDREHIIAAITHLHSFN